MKKHLLLSFLLLLPVSLLAQQTSAPIGIRDQSPHPVGGMKALYELIANEMQYPEDAIAQGIEGKVYVQFYVEGDGSLSEFTVPKSPGNPAMEEEAIRLIQLSSPWEPGIQNGKPQRVKMILPVNFALPKDEE